MNDPLLTINTVRICASVGSSHHTSEGGSSRQWEGEHLYCCLYDLPRPSSAIRPPEDLGRPRSVFRYRFSDLQVATWDSEIPLGDYLGEMTNELEGEDFIIDFTSAGAKNYGYVTKNGKACCKVRGFTLSNQRGHDQLNYAVMRTNLLDELQNPQDQRRTVPVTNPFFFTRDPATKDIRVKPRTKQYGLVFDKRVVNPGTNKTYPYGYGTLAEERDAATLLSLLK